MNDSRKNISWEPPSKNFSLKKRGAHEFAFDGAVCPREQMQSRDFSRVSCENQLLNYPKHERPLKSFSPLPSHRGDSQKLIPLNSFREAMSKRSNRSLLGGPESTLEIRPNQSTYEVLGPKNDPYADTNLHQLDNTPLNNSGSELENDIFKIKTLGEKDFISDRFSLATKERAPEEASFDQNFAIDSGLSEFAPIKPPNAYRQIASINYSNYNEEQSLAERASVPRHRDLHFQEDFSFGGHSNAVQSRRRMTPLELFKLNQRSPGHGRALASGEQFRRASESLAKGRGLFSQPPRLFKGKDRVSERRIAEQSPFARRRFSQMPPIRASPAVKLSRKPKRNLFHCSEKSISINEEVLRNNFQKKSALAQYNHGPPARSGERRREFSPFESNEPSQFKKVKREDAAPRRRPARKKASSERKKRASLPKNGSEERKKLEDERIENNMLESIGMIELGQFKRYRKLLAFLISLFVTGNVKRDSMDLHPEELQILKIIIYRKFKKHVDIK